MDWGNLLTHLTHKNCVPIIGAGASYPHLPLAAGLAKKLLEHEQRESEKLQLLDRPYPLNNRGNLLEVAQYLAVTHDGMYPKLKISDLVRESCCDVEWSENDPHLVLAELDLPIYVTTNYDNLMQLALERNGKKKVEAVICRWNDRLLNTEHTPFDDHYEPSSDHPVVFHLHGKMDVPASLVASEDDYLDFLVEMGKRHGSQQIEGNSSIERNRRYMIPPCIQNALSNKMLLFVGHGIADINFRVILRSLSSTIPSYRTTNLTVQYDDGGGFSEALKQYLEKYFKYLLELDVFWGTSQQFAKQLQDTLRTFHA
jgi:hypothetical protein